MLFLLEWLAFCNKCHNYENIKHQTSNIRVLLILIVTLFSSVHILRAQAPFGIPVYTNCFQRVEGGLEGGTNTFRFLNTSEGRTITMFSTNPFDIDVFEVYLRIDGIYELWNTGDGVLSIPNTTNAIQIIPIGTSGTNYSTTIIDFVDFDFQITPKPKQASCLTFDNLNIDLTHNLDGLCQNPLIQL